MRPLRFVLVLATGFWLAGCLHRPAGPGPASAPATQPAAAPKPAGGTAPAARLLERAATLNQVYLYVDATVAAAGTEDPALAANRNLALAEAVAVTLRDQLRSRGFDLRSAEAAAARAVLAGASDQEAFSELYALARAVAAGEPAPALARHATHLHPNAPSLLFFAALSGAAAETGIKHPAAPAVLGGYVADTTSGAVLWSHRVTLAAPADDAHVRQLAVELVRALPHLPDNPPAGTAAGSRP